MRSYTKGHYVGLPEFVRGQRDQGVQQQQAATDFVDGRMTCNTSEITYVNITGSTITKGMALKLDTAHAMSGTQPLWALTPVTAVTDKVVGFAVQNTPSGQNGTVQTVAGTVAVAIAETAITAGAEVGPSGATAGCVVTTTATDPYCGLALTAAVNALDPIFVLIQAGVTA